MLSFPPGVASASAEEAPPLSAAETVLTDTTLPFASLTVVVTDPSALVVTLVVSPEDELLPADDPALVALPDDAGAGDRVGSAEETWPMLPLMLPVRLLMLLP